MKAYSPSRKTIRAGDIFAVSFPALKGWVWGRVIRTDASALGVPTAILVYFYRIITPDTATIPLLSVDRLLIPPTMINKKPWHLGYFVTIASRPLLESDMLAQHCFFDKAMNIYYNEHYQVVLKRSEPCGSLGLASYRSADDELIRITAPTRA